MSLTVKLCGSLALPTGRRPQNVSFRHSCPQRQHSLRHNVLESQASKPASLVSVCKPAVRSGRNLVLRATGNDFDKNKDGFVKTANSVVDTVVEFVPSSVPRPAAKAAVVVVGFLFAFSLLQKLLSTVITLGVLAAAGYFFYTSSGIGGSGSAGEDIDASEDESLDEARRIMDKYK
mmetsp:Transcript_20029/g.47731  ORF Transcript_20029/g.47731 Transcript_20029/m.47731 type:complete len:176 (-) Transcript_20029:51-578(-)